MRSPRFTPKNIALGVAGLALTVLMGTSAHAQLTLTGTSYTQNFNDIGTSLPAGWSVDTGATASFLGYNINSALIATPATNTEWSSTSGGFKNYASATPFPNYAAGTPALQLSQTNRSLGVRQVGATDYRVAFVLQIANTTGLSNFDLSFKLQSLDSATSPRTTTWSVDYAVGSSPTTFTAATTTGTMTTGGNTYTNNTINVDFGTALDNKTGPVYIRIVALAPTTGSGNRASTGIDDYNLTWTGTGTATNIQVLTKTPEGNGIPLSTNTLKVKFDNPIAAGTGQVQLFKSGSATAVNTFAVPSASVTIADSTATFSTVSLENNTRYYVKMAAGSFTKTGGTLPNVAISDTTTWTFKTVDTATPPPPTPLTSLDETFTGCTSSAMGVFVQYSVNGPKTWRCSIFGHNDSSSVYINGGSAAGVSEANTDWLISKAPFNFSALASPKLSFWQKRRFEGTVTREIKISTNYVAGTDPTAASVTWTTIPVAALSNDPSLNWEQVSGIDLTAYKATPFYLAFTYSCGTNGAYELTYDDIKVGNTVGIFGPSRGNLALQVLGDATPAAIHLGISLEKATDLNVQIFDLTGRRVHNDNIKVASGKGVYTIANTNLRSGMYVIRVSNGTDFGTIKAVVK